jgi:CDP-glycerol glycerophosphotransferase (TagB/SpsB family)
LWLFPLYFLSGFVPRDRNLWVFGSWGGDRYADNGSAFFEFCNREAGYHMNLVWITRQASIVKEVRNKGYRAHLVWSLAGIWYGLRAGVYLFDCFSKDINFWTSRGATRVGLWSGVPLKAFERAIDKPPTRYYYLFHGNFLVRALLSALMPWHVVRPHLMIASSEEARRIVSRGFDVALENIHVTGLPRNDQLLLAGEPAYEQLPPSMAKAMQAGRKIFMYLPTLRDKSKGQFDFNWDKLNEALEERNCHLLLKLHPVDQAGLEVDLSNISIVEKGAEVYDLLPHVDSLISDYSSIIWDYMLLDRPIIYFLPDHEAFVAGGRALNFDIHDIAVGPVCETETELVEAISKVHAADFPPILEREDYRQTFGRLNAYIDANASRRVLDMLRDRELYDPAASKREGKDVRAQTADAPGA